MRLITLVGALTTAYSAALVVAPDILTKPAGLSGGEPDVRLLTRAIGVRDAALGAAMMAGSPQAARLAGITRAACDAGDAALFGARLSGQQRLKVSGVAGAWAVLSSLAAWRAGKQGAIR
jgi:hypothetical protein